MSLEYSSVRHVALDSWLLALMLLLRKDQNHFVFEAFSRLFSDDL